MRSVNPASLALLQASRASLDLDRAYSGSKPNLDEGDRLPGPVLPEYAPNEGHLPPSLRGRNQDFAFHFTEPELAAEIVRTGVHRGTGSAAGPSRLYMTHLGPHNAPAEVIWQAIFLGRIAKSPCLWGALIYRIQPHPNGLSLIPDPSLAPGIAFYYPTHRSGLAYVPDYLLAWGCASRPDGTAWHWTEP